MAGVVKFVKERCWWERHSSYRLLAELGASEVSRVTFGPVFTFWNKRFTCHLSHMY